MPIFGGECFGSQRPPPVALQMILDLRSGYASSSPYDGWGTSNSAGDKIEVGNGRCPVLK
jgi:hypothetical protein